MAWLLFDAVGIDSKIINFEYFVKVRYYFSGNSFLEFKFREESDERIFFYYHSSLKQQRRMHTRLKNKKILPCEKKISLVSLIKQMRGNERGWQLAKELNVVKVTSESLSYPYFPRWTNYTNYFFHNKRFPPLLSLFLSFFLSLSKDPSLWIAGRSMGHR